MSEPSQPEIAASASPLRKPVPLRWREEAAVQAHHAFERTHPRRTFHIVFWMLGLLGGIVGLLAWLDPVPRPTFAPMWVANYQSRLMPVVEQSRLDRIALREGNFFPRTLPDAYASQDRAFLLKDLEALRQLPRSENVVVYLSAFACSSTEGVWIFPGDVNPDDPSTRIPLRDVLAALRDCPAAGKLLILDIMQPLAALGEPGIPPGRLGVLVDDVSSRVAAELEAVPDPQRHVLCACAPGEVAQSSQGLGHTVLGYYIDQGLRGWADPYSPTGKTDGRISAEGLSLYAQQRTRRWAWRNLGVRQTPVLHGGARDFNLLALDHGEPRPYLPVNRPETYPKWLAEDWRLLDRWRAEGNYRLAPRLFRQLEALVARAEQKWRGGYPAEDGRKERQPELDLIRAEFNRVRESLKAPEPRSLALARALGRKPDAALTTALHDTLAKVTAETRSLPPDKAGPVRTKLTSAFVEKYRSAPHFDLAAAIFAEAVNDPDIGIETVRWFDSLLRMQDPQPHYVETLFLHRLAELAEKTGPNSWPGKTVHLALQVVARGEQAASRPRAFRWVENLLDQADQTRYNGEVLLLSPGYAPVSAALERLELAGRLYGAILAFQDDVQQAEDTLDEAFIFLPPYVAYLDKVPGPEKTWYAAVDAAVALYESLQLAPGKPNQTESQLRNRCGSLRQKREFLQGLLDELRRPLGPDNQVRLKTQAKRETAGPAVIQEIEALLATPYLHANDRIGLWKSGEELALRLREEVFQLDQEDDTALPRLISADSDRDHLERQERERGIRRARLAAALFRLGGLAANRLQQIDSAVEPAAQGKITSAALAKLGSQLQRVWVEQLPTQVQKETGGRARDRLATIAPPLDYLPSIDLVAARPRLEVLNREAQELWRWLALRYLYQSRDLNGSSFYFEAAREYAHVAGVNLPAYLYLEIAGCPTAIRLTTAEPVATCPLVVRAIGAPADKIPVQLRIRTADDDWLQVTPMLPAADRGDGGVYSTSLELSAAGREVTVPLRIALKPGAERSGVAPPRGVLVEITIRGFTFHHRVPVTVAPPEDLPQLVLSTNPKQPTAQLGDLRLRTVETPQPFYLFVRNPTNKAINVLVELSAAGVTALPPAKVTIAPKAVERIVFLGVPTPPAPPSPAPPPANVPAVPPLAPRLPELRGPLHIRLLDAANPSRVFEARDVRVHLAWPREYVDVKSIQYLPPSAANQGQDMLDVRLAARPNLAGPPVRAELVLPPDRIPGFLGAKDGTFRGLLPPAGQEFRLFATGLQFAEGQAPTGFVYVNIDSYARAFIFRTTFARQGTPVTPQEDLQPALRIQTPAIARADPNFAVTIEVDNAPPDATLELALGRQLNRSFVPDLVRKLPEARQRRIGFTPFSPDGALLFDASIQDWNVTLDTSLIIGPRVLRARLLGADGEEVKVIEQPILLVDRAPADVQFVNTPSEAVRGMPLPVQALGYGSGTTVKQVLFFVGKPVQGKVPPNTPTTPGSPMNNKGLWSAQLPIPLASAGPTDISVQFINAAGISTFATTTVNVLDKPPPLFGKVSGTVTEAMRPQAGLDVVLRDAKGMAVKDEKGVERKVTTGADGTFLIDKIPPGKYQVLTTKPTSGRKAEATVEVEAGKTAEVMLMLLL